MQRKDALFRQAGFFKENCCEYKKCSARTRCSDKQEFSKKIAANTKIHGWIFVFNTLLQFAGRFFYNSAELPAHKLHDLHGR